MVEMKNKILLKFAILASVFVASQAFGWHFTVTNLTNTRIGGVARYASNSCNEDHFNLAPINQVGSTTKINAKGCLLSEIALNDIPQQPYTSYGRRDEAAFYIVGPIENEYRVGRFE